MALKRGHLSTFAHVIKRQISSDGNNMKHADLSVLVNTPYLNPHRPRDACLHTFVYLFILLFI